MNMLNPEKIKKILELTKVAGEQIKAVRHAGFNVELKSDESPVTIADKRSHETIIQGLKNITPDITIVSEEDANHATNFESNTYWLIDPLDGTKEFISGGEDFTVNIALIHEKTPVFGFIYVPAKDIFYWNDSDYAYKKLAGKTMKIQASEENNVKSAVASKSHFDEKTRAFLSQFGEINFQQAGSSLKICLVAEGVAEIYPRFAPTMEWDTAAGDAIARKSGAKMLNIYGDALNYSKQDFKNDGFICVAPNINFKIED